jgi:hypothetical protein
MTRSAHNRNSKTEIPVWESVNYYPRIHFGGTCKESNKKLFILTLKIDLK